MTAAVCPYGINIPQRVGRHDRPLSARNVGAFCLCAERGYYHVGLQFLGKLLRCLGAEPKLRSAAPSRLIITCISWSTFCLKGTYFA